MAGLGRRTHYRKHLTDSVLYDLPEPKEDERIAKVTATRGGNQFDIILAAPSNSNTDNPKGLAILPTKFHKLVWVKRNDYVIVQTGIDQNQDGGDGNDDDEKEGGGNEDQAAKTVETSSGDDPNESGIRFIITHILYKDQVKHLVSKGLWPTHDLEFSDSANDGSAIDTNNSNDDGIVYNADENDYDDDGIVYNDYDMENDDDLFVNTNRIARLEIQDSDESSQEESSDEEDWKLGQRSDSWNRLLMSNWSWDIASLEEYLTLDGRMHDDIRKVGRQILLHVAYQNALDNEHIRYLSQCPFSQIVVRVSSVITAYGEGDIIASKLCIQMIYYYFFSIEI